MFENAGEIIKKIAIVNFIISLIASIICAFVFGRNKWGSIEIWALIGILLGGSFISYISSLFLYAFGDITENIKSMAASAEKTAIATKAVAGEAVKKENSSVSRIYSNSNASLNDTWICKKCGTRNLKTAVSCKDCGAYK